MGTHFKAPSAVMLLLLRDYNGKQQILLQKRSNTGYMDGMWECAASGHVEENESMRMALVREAKEETGITIAIEDVAFKLMAHKYMEYTPSEKSTYCNAYFMVTKYCGEPHIAEPHKCSDLQWFDIDKLPEDLIPDRKIAIECFLKEIPYFEDGINSCKNVHNFLIEAN